jgi:hypothetical protein
LSSRGASGSSSRVILVNMGVFKSLMISLFGPEVMFTTVLIAGKTTLCTPSLYTTNQLLTESELTIYIFTESYYIDGYIVLLLLWPFHETLLLRACCTIHGTIPS